MSAHRERLGLALGAGAVLGLVLWAYQPVLDNGFLCDDYSYLQVGHMIAGQPSLALAQGPVWELYLGAWRRPVGNLLWAGLVSGFGFRPAPLYALLLAVHLINAALLGGWLAKRTARPGVALLGAGLFATAYGVRDVVCWLSNLNEALCLTAALTVLLLRERRCPPVALTALLLAAALIKESVVPLALALPLLDRLDDAEPDAWRRVARRWAPPAAMVAGYLAWRLWPSELGYYSGYRLGAHLPANWLALVTGAYASDLLPVWLERGLGVGWLLPWINVAGALATLAVALAGRGPARGLAIWVLLQALAFAPMDSFGPERVPARYLYLATAPAMGLVAVGLSGLWRAARQRRGVLLAAVLLSLASARWQGYGLLRLRADEREHWDAASRALRRDMALLDAADLPPDSTIVLLMPAAEVPAGGTWWGWEGYPLVARQPVRRLVRHVGEAPPAEIPRPYALFRYSKEQGPVFAGMVE